MEESTFKKLKVTTIHDGTIPNIHRDFMLEHEIFPSTRALLNLDFVKNHIYRTDYGMFHQYSISIKHCDFRNEDLYTLIAEYDQGTSWYAIAKLTPEPGADITNIIEELQKFKLEDSITKAEDNILNNFNEMWNRHFKDE